MMTLPRTVADVLSDHVTFEVECIDRMYLNVWVPRLAYGGGETGQELLGELVLALSLGESDQLQATRGDEVVNVGHERLAHGIHQRGRGITVAAMADEEPHDSAAVGQSGHPDVEIHPIDALDLEGHVVGEHIGDGAR